MSEILIKTNTYTPNERQQKNGIFMIFSQFCCKIIACVWVLVLNIPHIECLHMNNMYLSAKIAHQCIFCCTWKLVRKLSCMKNQTSNEICHFLFFSGCCCHWAREALNVYKSISWLCPSLIKICFFFFFLRLP